MNLVLATLFLALSWPCRAAFDPHFDQGAPQMPVFNGGEATPAPAAPAQRVFKPHERLWIVAEAAPQALLAEGISVEEVRPGRVAGIGNGRMAQRLAKKGVKFSAAPLRQVFHAMDFPPEDAAFHNYARTQSELASLAAEAPELASVFSIGKSIQGRDILALRLNTTASGESFSSKPGAVFFGTHHAREHISTEVPLLIARWLVENRNKPDVQKLLAARDVYIIPMVNPDGVEWDIREGAYHMHRKNARDNGMGPDAIGVDLNRNYGSHWGESGSSTDPESDIYQGAAPDSEPETQAVERFIAQRPNLKMEASYHSYSELIMYPWSYTDGPISDGRALAAYKKMADDMAAMTGYTAEQSSALYPSSGDTCDWSWAMHGVFSFTFELTPKSDAEGGFYPGASAIAATFQANLRPALYMIDLADDPYRAAGAAATAGR